MSPRFLFAVVLVGALSSAFAWRLSGSEGLGWFAGFTSALVISAWGFAYQARLLSTGSAHPLQALAIAFLLKLFVIVSGALIVRFVPEVGARVDLTTFLLAFPAGIVTVLALAGAHHWLRLKRGSSTSSAPSHARSA